MIKPKQVVKLSNLINDCVIMIQQAGQLVQKTNDDMAGAGAFAAARRAASRSAAKSQDRDQNIADVDFLIRQTYMHNLSQLFPGIQIICEGERPIKDAHFAESAFIQPDELLETRKSPILTSSLLQETAEQRCLQTQHYQDQLAQVMQEDNNSAASVDLIAGAYTEELQTTDVAVWIDPIDGSRAFAEGNLDQVTNMIGITVGGRPRVGIIHKPFMSERQNSSRTYVGSTESGLFYFDHSKSNKTTSEPTYVSPFKTTNLNDVTVSKTGNFQPPMCFGTEDEQETIMEKVFKDIMPSNLNRIEDPGNKFLHLTNERSDFFMNLEPGYSMWDLCASEAIFASRFGILTDAKQKPLIYDSSRRSFGLYNGVVAARDAGVYLSAKRTFESKSGMTLAASQTKIRRDIHLKN